MTDKQKSDYSRSFELLDPNKTGIISAVDAVGFLRKSKLPENVLREIWKLSDLGRDGALDLTEFCIAMHLVLKARANIPIPPTLPLVLLPEKYASAEQKAAALKEQQQKEQQERQLKEQKEAELKEQQLKKQQAKEKEEKERQEKERQEKEAKEQAAKPDEKSDAKAAEPEGEPKPEPPKNKFMTRPPTEAATAPSPAPAPAAGRSREPRPADDRQRSPKPRAVSPAARGVSPSPRATPVAATDNSSIGLPVAPSPALPGKKQDFGVSSRVTSVATPVKNPDAPKGALASSVRAWVEAVLNEKIPVSISIGDALKSGVRLCKMLNIIEPDSVLDISNSQFMRRENILCFLEALRKKGFKPVQMFSVDDLFEMQDVDAVLECMVQLDTYAGKIKFHGPRLKL